MFRPGLFTPTETILMNILADGMPHSRKDLIAALPNDQSDFTNLSTHLSNIRKKLAPYGRLVICEIYNRTVHYRQVRHINCGDHPRFPSNQEVEEVS
jgi:hypothetical protein